MIKRPMSVDKVYKFGCRPPRECALALQVLGQAFLYRDDLRRAYNAHKRELRAQFSGAAEASHVVAWENHFSAQDEIGHVFAYEKQRVWEGRKASLNAAVRKARGARGHLLDAGTYWLLEAAMLQASKDSGLDPIKPTHWDGTGRIGAAIQSKDQFLAAEWSHKRVSLEMDQGPAPSKRKQGLGELSIVVGDQKAGQRIVWPIKMHRPFPEEAIVKQVAIQRTRVGHRFSWEAIVTINYEESRGDVDANAEGVCGVDIGWRAEAVTRTRRLKKMRVANDGARRMEKVLVTNEEVHSRVATHEGHDGLGALRTDALRSFKYSDDVRGTRDLTFDGAKKAAKEKKLPGGEFALLWRNKDRLHKLADRTQDQEMLEWHERDKHLEDIEAGARARAVRRRQDEYRVYADRLARQYRFVALEDMPMSSWVGRGDTSGLERQRSSAALYSLQMAILQRFGASRVDWVPPAFSSMTCGSCGVVRATPVGKAPFWVCACGVRHHQDENAAAILRARSERWIADGNPPRARKRKPSNKKGKGSADAIAIGDGQEFVITSRRSIEEAAE